MALRRTLLVFGLVLLAGLLGWQFRPGEAAGPGLKPDAAESMGHPSFAARSWSFSYHSLSYLNPVLSTAKAGDRGLTMACHAKGQLHAMAQHTADLRLIFEFSEIMCGEADILADRALSHVSAWDRDYLQSLGAVEAALQNPNLAIARSIFLAMNLDFDRDFSKIVSPIADAQLRAEGRVDVAFQSHQGTAGWLWTKSYQGPLTTALNPLGLNHHLELEVQASSQSTRPLELALNELKATEKIQSFQKKRLIARTELQIHLQHLPNMDQARLKDLLAEGTLAPSVTGQNPLTAEERARVLDHWKAFRDQEGQKPVYGESMANQEVYIELKQSLRKDPELANELAMDLKDMDPASSGFATLAGALVYSGEAEALDAFVREAEQHRDQYEWQSRALPLAGLAPKPNVSSWQYLDEARKKQQDPNLSRAAELGMATHLKQGYADKGAQVYVDELLQRMQAASSEGEQLQLLDLVGNAGLEKGLSIIETWLAHGSLALRIRISQALRNIQNPRAEQILLQLATESPAELSLAALQNLRNRTPSSAAIPILLGLLSQSPEDRVRMLCLDNLYAARLLDPELLEKVKRIRQGITLSSALRETWDQVERDWTDSTET